MNNEVSIVHCDTYDPEKVLAGLQEAMELCPPPDVKGKKVLLKPNILWDSPPDLAITTHPAIVHAAALLFHRLGAEVLVGDSPGLHPKSFPAGSCGIREAAESAGARWVDFAEEKMTLQVPEGRQVKKFTVSRVVEEVDMIVSLPKMKTHTLMYYTGAMKNLFGVIPGTLKASFHARFPGREVFAGVMVDLNQALMASYALMDGIVGLEGPGPGKAGKPKRLGLLMASQNLLALDITAAGLMGYHPLQLPMQREALERGLWLNSVDDIVIKGLSPESVKPEHFETIPVPKKRGGNFLNYLVTSLSMTLQYRLRAKPEFSHSVCIRCGECVAICPAGALSFTGTGKSKEIAVNYKKCIRCYCCHEICPVGAITMKGHPLP